MIDDFRAFTIASDARCDHLKAISRYAEATAFDHHAVIGRTHHRAKLRAGLFVRQLAQPVSSHFRCLGLYHLAQGWSFHLSIGCCRYSGYGGGHSRVSFKDHHRTGTVRNSAVHGNQLATRPFTSFLTASRRLAFGFFPIASSAFGV
jgi:hypothetical protein